MSDYPPIYVLRHGQTEWNLAGRFQGHMDSPLTDLGQEQARRQGAILAGLDLDLATTPAFTSPQPRASRTAELAGLVATSDDRLKEVYFGRLEGRYKDEIYAELGPKDQNAGLSWHFETPDGERYAQMHARCLAFLQELRGPSIVVTHGITSLVLRGIWLGIDRAAMAKLSVQQGCVYCVNNDGHHVLD